MFKKGLSASPLGRRSVEKGRDLLPIGEALARNIDSSPPPRGGRSQEIDMFSSPPGRHLPDIWTVLLPHGEADPRIIRTREFQTPVSVLHNFGITGGPIGPESAAVSGRGALDFLVYFNKIGAVRKAQGLRRLADADAVGLQKISGFPDL